eukprot:6482883-Prymnesium_polylepis.2
MQPDGTSAQERPSLPGALKERTLEEIFDRTAAAALNNLRLSPAPAHGDNSTCTCALTCRNCRRAQ